MADTNTVQYWVDQVNTKVEGIVDAMKQYVDDFSLDIVILPDDTDISTYKGVANKLYLLKDTSVSEGNNWYNEYLYVNEQMELIGTTKPDIKNFYTKAEIVEMLKSYYLKTETYSQTEVDTKLSAKADTSTTYTKTEVDTALGKKANSADVYTKTLTYSKTEADSLLANKANSSDVYTKTETGTAITNALKDYYTKTLTYSKTEADALLTVKANATDVYTKEETNSAISTEGAKHYLKSETYTKTEVDTALSAKANASVTYTKTEVDTALSAKADADDVYTKTATYSKTEVDDLLDDKANSADVYNKTLTYSKTEVDELLDDKANSADVYTKTLTYSKTEADTLLNAKANASTTYTKTEVDTALGKKANSSDVYTTSVTYTKTEVDNLVAGKAVISKVDALPTTGNSNTLYVVANGTSKTGNLYSEYLWVNNAWELVGSTDVDLSGYYTASEVDDLLDDKADASALAAKVDATVVYTKTEVDTALGKKLGKTDKAASASVADSATSATTATKDASGNVFTTTYATKTELAGKMDAVTLAAVATSGSYNDLSNKPTIPSAVTETTVSGWGFTKNAGTVTSVNNISPVSGNVTISIPAAVTESTVSGWGFTKNAGTVKTVNSASPDANGNVTIAIPSTVTESTVSGWGFTKNAGTLTGIKMNGSTVGTSGTIDLGTVITSHQDISGKANTSDVYTKTEIDSKLTSVYRYKGSVASYDKLPTSGQTAGDVYNVEAADSTHGIKAGDNVAWTGSAWDVLGGTIDTSKFATVGHTHTSSDVSGLATVATSGSYNDLSNKPTIPSAVTETTVSGWGFTKNAGTITGITMNGSTIATSGTADLGTVITAHQDISGKANTADLATVATSGSYNDLSNKPTIPTVNNATLTIQKNGTNVATFTANSSSAATANITVPTKVSELTNDSGFTANAGTITGVKMNGSTVATSGTVDLGTVITAHQDISGKQDKTTAVTHTASTAAGSATQPVYVNVSGVATACTYSLNKTVPSDAVFTDTNTKVTQTVSTANGDYPLLAKASTATATATDSSVFAAAVKVNPSTGNITATKFTGALTGNVTGNCSGSSGSCTGNAATTDRLKNGGNQSALADATQPSSGLQVFQVYNNGYPTTYGNVLSIGGTGQGQLLAGWSGSDAGTEYLYYRNQRDTGTKAWSAWKKVAYTDSNITGSSASCTGNAATATSATKATQDASGNVITDTYALKTTAVTHTASTAVGSASQPVYIASTGVATTCNTIPSTTTAVTSGSTAALTSGGAYTNLVRRASTTAATGGANQGVYINASGQVVACNATTSTYSATGTTAVNGTAVNSGLEAALKSLSDNLAAATPD